MSISIYPSVVTLPGFDRDAPPLLVIDFLSTRFPQIPRGVWQARVEHGKVLDADDNPITLKSLASPHGKIRYFREVALEPPIPFMESILFQNNHLLVADKPHFLPVTPCGPYVSQSLLNRLKSKTGIFDLVPIHRIDRETAGVVLFSVEKKSRGLYQKLFMDGKIRKTYMALTQWPDEESDNLWPKGVMAESRIGKEQGHVIEKRDPSVKIGEWIIDKRIVKGDPWFRMKIDENGKPNSTTRVEVIGVRGKRALLRLFPETGKKHQIRLHLSSIGCPIVNDHFYPHLLPEALPDFDNPLKLLAQRLEFTDPVSGAPMDFVSSLTIEHV